MNYTISIINLIRRSKDKKFDQLLWLKESPSQRIEYSYKETTNWKEKNNGVITYPCCPHCGSKVGEDNREFTPGWFCSEECRMAWKLHYRNRNDMAWLSKCIRNEIAIRKINTMGDGI